MARGLLALFLFFSSYAHAGFLKRLCSQIIADDPYEFESYTADQLLNAYNYFHDRNSFDETLVREVKSRLDPEIKWKNGEISHEDRIILSSILLRAEKDRPLKKK